MFSEHDEELNENEDAFMSVEADAEAGDESVYHHNRSLTPHIAFVTFSLSP